jgi:thiamine-phosphate pyrophosphorylase
MKLVVFTQPQCFVGEELLLTQLFAHGLERLHLRKPLSPVTEVAELLRRLPEAYHERIQLHDYDLTSEFPRLGGLHLNSRRPTPPTGYRGRLSASCHTLQEVEQRRSSVDYLFLSPLFDSISKQGYTAAFTRQELEVAQREEIIDRRVIALGGITAERLPEVAALGFGGAAVLGTLWRHVAEPAELLQTFDHLLQTAAAQPTTPI